MHPFLAPLAFPDEDAVLVPCDGNIQVILNHVLVVTVSALVADGAERPTLICACQRTLRNYRLLIRHVRHWHFTAACQAASVVSPPIPFPGYVTPRERRARMPWRVVTPESK